jgi:hypothetical protein
MDTSRNLITIKKSGSQKGNLVETRTPHRRIRGRTRGRRELISQLLREEAGDTKSTTMKRSITRRRVLMELRNPSLSIAKKKGQTLRMRVARNRFQCRAMVRRMLQ